MAVLLAAAVVSIGVQAPLAGQPSPMFRFHTDELWLNLHQFLYVLGRHEAGMADRTRRAVAGAPADEAKGHVAIAPDEQRRWRDAVSLYARGPSRQDAIFDTPLIDLAHALVRAGSSGTLTPADPAAETMAALASVVPVYRRVWWPDHERANEAWVASIRPLLDKHGTAAHAFITRAYRMPWPSGGYPVHVTAYTNWAGAFSTRGDLLLISSLDPGNRGPTALEVVFHEAMHQWDEAIDRLLSAEAARQNVRVPPALSHALIFHTAGEAVRHVVSGYVPYAESNGMWQRGTISPFKAALDTAWKPYLSGRGTRDEAVAALIAALRSG